MAEEEQARALVRSAGLPLDQNPAAVDLSRLATGSRRTMETALSTLAKMLTGRECAPVDIARGAVRYQHAQAIRAALAEKRSPATVNKHLAALRGVLKEAWRLGQMPSDARGFG